MYNNNNKSFYLLLSLLIPCRTIATTPSTILVIWPDANNNYYPVDIQLNNYYYAENNSSNKIPPLSTTTTALLATNITFYKNNSYPIEIPPLLRSNLSPSFTYSLITIINSIKGTQLASSRPLNLKTLKTEFKESLLLLSSSPPTTITNPLLVANSSSSSPTISNNTYQQQISSHDDIGPTLSSTQVAVIAMAFIGCSGILFLFHFTVKWILGKRREALNKSSEKKPWQDNQQQYDIRDTSLYRTTITTETSVSNGTTNSCANNNNNNNKKYFTLGNIEEEDYFTTIPNRNYDSRLTPAPRQSSSSRSSSPFGEPPQSFNGNRYIPTLPPNAYPHNQ